MQHLYDIILESCCTQQQQYEKHARAGSITVRGAGQGLAFLEYIVCKSPPPAPLRPGLWYYVDMDVGHATIYKRVWAWHHDIPNMEKQIFL